MGRAQAEPNKQKKIKKTSKIMVVILLSLIGLLVIALCVVGINSPGKLPPLKNPEGGIIQGSISEKVWIDINGIKQGMFIRGENPDNPVILYLHGGPGTPMLQFILYLEEGERPEKYFTVCYWDQRGAGMTYSKYTDPQTMTIEQMVEDTREITNYLKSRFGQDKIYLLGHSWGSYLGVKTIEKYPEDYLAYIGIGQITNQTESERLAYQYMLKHAKEMNDQDVVKKLVKYNPNADGFPQLDYLLKARTEILNKYGIGHLHRGLTFQDIFKAFFVFKGYTLSEKKNWFSGADFSMVHLFPVILNDNLFISSKKIDLPFYIIQGAYDYQVSQVLAEKYLEVLDAPKKEFILFENSAHSPNMEESVKFIRTIRGIAEQNSM